MIPQSDLSAVPPGRSAIPSDRPAHQRKVPLEQSLEHRRPVTRRPGDWAALLDRLNRPRRMDRVKDTRRVDAHDADAAALFVCERVALPPVRHGDDVLAEVVAGRAAEQVAEAAHRTDVLLFGHVDGQDRRRGSRPAKGSVAHSDSSPFRCRSWTAPTSGGCGPPGRRSGAPTRPDATPPMFSARQLSV